MRQTHCVVFLFLSVLRVGYFFRVNSATLNCQESYTFSNKESFSLTIETPSYPNKYGNNENCWWAFVIPAGLQFRRLSNIILYLKQNCVSVSHSVCLIVHVSVSNVNEFLIVKP